MKEALKDAADELGVAVAGLKAGKAFEAVVLFRIALRLDHLFDQLHVLNHNGEPTTEFVLRGAPGHIPTKYSTGEEPSYIELDNGPVGWSVELHNSLEFDGASGVEHELDVAMIWKEAAEQVRNGKGGTVPVEPILGLELKDHAAHATLEKNLIRAFVTCVIELSPLRHFGSISVGREYPRKEVETRRPWFPLYYYLTPASLSGPSRRLAEFYGIMHFANLAPSDLDSVMGDIHLKFAVGKAIFERRLPHHPIDGEAGE